MDVITIENMTKNYGDGKGIFDVSFAVKEGEVYGFLGPNGAGKTTTIRTLMGFIRPERGRCALFGMECFSHADEIHRRLGYLPGEIAFMDDMTGTEFVRFIAALNGIRDLTEARRLEERFELNVSGKIKKMSKGMKQKIGIVCAFMGLPEVLILDEPTSGLDPLMQNRFIELVLETKARGATVLMSSHMFEEIERTCGRAAIIKGGRIVSVEDIATLRHSAKKQYHVRLANQADAAQFAAETAFSVLSGGERDFVIEAGDLNALLRAVGGYEIARFDSHEQTLEELFLHFYAAERG